MTKDRIFTKEELLKVTELAQTFNNEVVARHFDIEPSRFSRLKKSQPALAEAYSVGMANRQSGVKLSNKDKPTELKVITESMLNKHVQELSPQEALDNFKKQFEENKQRNLRVEAKNIDLI